MKKQEYILVIAMLFMGILIYYVFFFETAPTLQSVALVNTRSGNGSETIFVEDSSPTSSLETVGGYGVAEVKKLVPNLPYYGKVTADLINNTVVAQTFKPWKDIVQVNPQYGGYWDYLAQYVDHWQPLLPYNFTKGKTGNQIGKSKYGWRPLLGWFKGMNIEPLSATDQIQLLYPEIIKAMDYQAIHPLTTVSTGQFLKYNI
jgi:hypothetical protein